MIEKEYWDFNPSWLEYVERTWQGNGRVESVSDDTKERQEFEFRSHQAFLDRGIHPVHIKTYLSVQVPKTAVGYDEQYPHVHEPQNATTLVHYLQPGDEPAPLDIFEGDEVVETIYPEVGLTVFIPNSTMHGVHINNGQENRIALIATAHSKLR